MCISEFLKIIGVLIITLGLGLIQVTFTSIAIRGVVPNLVLVLVFGVTFLELKSKSQLGWRSYTSAIGGGILLDIFSSLPLGTEALMLLIIILMLEQVFKFLDKVNFLIYSISFLLVTILYQLVFNLLSFGAFRLSWVLIVYNYLLAVVLYFLCFLGTILKEK
ncbi:MAG: hypothetical protein V5A57_03035 [Candidatus Paceibacterota bacterium]